MVNMSQIKKLSGFEYVGYILSLVLALLFALNVFPNFDLQVIIGLLLLLLIIISLSLFRLLNLVIEVLLVLCLLLSLIPFIGIFFSLLGFILSLLNMSLYKSHVFYKIVSFRAYDGISKKKPLEGKNKNKDKVLDAEFEEK